MNEYINNTYEVLNAPNTTTLVSWLYGAIVGFTGRPLIKDLAKEPLSTIFWRLLSGTVHSIGANIVAELIVPDQLRAIIPISLLISMFYYKVLAKRRGGVHIYGNVTKKGNVTTVTCS